MGFGRWLYAARKQAEMTQQELADCAGIEKSYIGLLENETVNKDVGLPREPSISLVKKLAQCLGQSDCDALATFCGGDGEKSVRPISSGDVDINKAVIYFHQLDSDDRSHILDIIKTFRRRQAARGTMTKRSIKGGRSITRKKIVKDKAG